MSGKKIRVVSARDHPVAGWRLNLDNRNNVMVAVDNDDLIIDDEVEKPAPFRMDFDQHGRDLDYAHRSRYDRSNSDLEVDVVDPRRIAALQHGFADLGLLLGCQCRASWPGALAFGTLASLPLGLGPLAPLGIIASASLTLGALAGLTLWLGALLLLILLTLLLALLSLLLLLNLLLAFGLFSLSRALLLLGILAAITFLRRLLSLLSLVLLSLSGGAAFRSWTLLLHSLRCSKNRTCQQEGCCRCQN